MCVSQTLAFYLNEINRKCFEILCKWFVGLKTCQENYYDWEYMKNIHAIAKKEAHMKTDLLSKDCLSSSENKAWKRFRSVRDLNPWPLRYRCSALPTKLTSWRWIIFMLFALETKGWIKCYCTRSGVLNWQNVMLWISVGHRRVVIKYRKWEKK